MSRKAFDIPNIYESLAADVRNGASWEAVAVELFKAGDIPYVSPCLAKMRVENYLKLYHRPWYRVVNGNDARRSFLMFVNGRAEWTTSAEGAAFFETDKAAYRAVVDCGLSDCAYVEEVT